MKMTDKDWLARLTTAYKVYPYPSKEIERYIKWMYEQYGIIEPNKDNK